MRKRIIRSLLAGALAGCLFAGCWEKESHTEQEQEGRYTLRCVSASPGSWDPLGESPSEGRRVLDYTTTPLYQVTEDENGAREVVPALAETMPADVTAQFAGKEPYGIAKDAKAGYAWQITLRQGAAWENGEKITAETVAGTLMTILSPERQGAQTLQYIDGELPLTGAAEYHARGFVPAADGRKLSEKAAGKKLYFAPERSLPVLGNCSLSEYYRYYAPDEPQRFRDERGRDIFLEIRGLLQGEYTEAGPELMGLLDQLARAMGYDGKNPGALFCLYQDESLSDWKHVGVLAEGSSLTLILKRPVDSVRAALGLRELLLVPQKLYAKLKGAYGTSSKRYLSYGPYRITSYQKDEGMVLKKNKKWFGYKALASGKQYQTTDIDIDYRSDEAQVLAELKQGKYDCVFQSAQGKADGDKKRISVPRGSDSCFYLLNGELAETGEEQEEGTSRKLLGYRDFRQGFAMLFNRNVYAETYGEGGTAQYGIFNDSYLLSLQGDSYRSTAAGKRILSSVYGVKSPEDLAQNGAQDMKRAGKLMASAYDVCLEDGNIQDTDTVLLTLSAGPGEDVKAECKYLQQCLSAAVLGGPLEGRIRVQPAEDGQRGDIAKERIGGDRYDPWALLDVLYGGSSGLLRGAYPDLEKLTMKPGGKKVTDTLGNWAVKVNNGTYKKDSQRLVILSGLEQRLLESYLVIPLHRNTRTLFFSDRIREDTLTGEGLNLSTLGFTMDDRDWAQKREGSEK